MFETVDRQFAEWQFTRPARRSDFLERACAERLGVEAVDVPLAVEDAAEPLRCFWNVAAQVEKCGGEVVFGWAIFEWPYLFWEVQHHAVWRNREGALVDITPPPPISNCPTTLFVPDPSTGFDLSSIDAMPEETKRFPLLDWSELADYTEMGSRIRQRTFSLDPDWLGADRMLQDYRKEERGSKDRLLLRLANTLQGSDRCFCGWDSAFDDCCKKYFSA